MNFKLKLFFLLLTTSTLIAFPQLSKENAAIIGKLTNQINASPNSVELRFELAMAYAYTGWIELGWDQLSLIPKLSNDYHQTVYNKYYPITQKEPNNWKAHFKLAFAYHVLGKKDLAIESFKKVLEIKPNHVWSMGLIALIYGEKKDYNTGIDWCKKALKINNDATAIHFLLGAAYYETGNYFGILGESLSVGRLKSIEAKYRPIPPIGIIE
jgi:tetratricopeptide (TPR) repeat protein